MAEATETSQLANDGVDSHDFAAPTSSGTDLPVSESAIHPQEAEIIRQVEYYFSDDNLRQDAHMLGLIKEGKGSMSLNELLGFPKMRKFKPKSVVKQVLKQSTVVEISEDNKRIKRRSKLGKPITVLPKINPDRKKTVVPEDKPWLTKGMLKPTGFESFATDGPVKPDEYEQDRQDYDSEVAFTSRIETAIMRFCSRRKMHQYTRAIFEKFLVFGGIDTNQRQFTGGLDEKSMEDYTKKEIAELTSYYGISERVLDGLYDNGAQGEATWYVDFEATAKAFLSSRFVNHFDWYSEDQVKTATNVLRNFYNYLLLHDVCLEYKDQLIAAREVCDLAEEELPKLKEVDMGLPGGFNVACSTLFGGNYANLYASGGDWVREDDNLGWSKDDAHRVFMAGIFAHGTEEQLRKVEDANANGAHFKVISEDTLGLEVVAVEFANDEARSIYEDASFTNTIVKPMGKLHCNRWVVPHAAPVDLPASIIKQQNAQTFEFLVDDDILKFCSLGMKIEAKVIELDLGVKWIDYVENTYASFFTWLMNERIREWKEPGPPKSWMLRSMGRDNGTVSLPPSNGNAEREGEDYDDEEPD